MKKQSSKLGLMSALVITFCAVITLAACSRSDSAQDSAKPPIMIGVLVKTQSDTFQRKINEAVDAQLEMYKQQGIIKDYINLDADSDVQKQLNQADDLIARKVNVIIMAPQDGNGCSPIVEKTNQAGIPLVVLNSKTDNVDQATTFVGSDDVNAGEIMGHYLIEQLGGRGSAKGTVCQLEGAIGNSAQIGRNQGLENTLYREAGIQKLEVLTAKWQRDEAMRITEDWLQKYPDISAIACENDDMAIGAMNAVKNAKRKSQTIIIGIDAIDDALVAVKNGDMDATIFQDAKGQGSMAASVAVGIATGKTVEKQYLIPFVLITKQNVADYLQP